MMSFYCEGTERQASFIIFGSSLTLGSRGVQEAEQSLM